MDLRDFFESIDAAEVGRFVEESREESLHLDFKEVTDSGMSSRDTRRDFAKYVTSFANSEGGVIIWGVACRPNEDGVDCASEVCPVDDLPLFASKLQRYTAECASPVADGVIHERIPIEGGTGLIKTLIPPSDFGPHMAKLGENRYFKRSGSSVVRMEHFDIADMMGRRPQPHVELTHRVCQAGVHKVAASITRAAAVAIGLRNSGRGLARAPYLALRIESEGYALHQYGLDGNGNIGLPKLASSSDSEWTRYGGSAETVVHPGTTLEITRVHCQFGSDDDAVQDLMLTAEFAAEGALLQSVELRVEARELVAAPQM